MNKKLYRDEYHKVLGGVCSGLAQYFDMDVTIVRLLFAFTFFVMGVGLGTYIILWIVLPRRGFMYNNGNNAFTVDYTIPQQQPADEFNAQQQANPFGNNPYEGNPFYGDPAKPVAPKQKSHAGIIFGLVLIVVGGIILVDNLDLIPDIDFGQLWPIILVFVGAAMIVSGQQKKAWHRENWAAEQKAADEAVSPAAPETEAPVKDDPETL
ncbi:MAG TPA: PspC domain-containing protein [Mucilaginibacter sp.]